MKSSAIITVLLAASAAPAQDQPAAPPPAQPQIARTNVVAKAQAPTQADMYCSGFISPEALPTSTFITQGEDAPFQTMYTNTETVFLTGGDFQPGAKFSILRAVRDINRYEVTGGQNRRARAAGIPYQELGRVTIEGVQKGIGIARVEFSCDGLLPGDIALPFQERQIPQFRRVVPFDLWAEPNGKTTGRILAFNEFDVIQADRGKLYVDIGSGSGIKPGDYLRLTRTFESMYKDDADKLSNKASVIEPSRWRPAKNPIGKEKDYPRKSLGEAMVLHTTANTATAMIVRSWEQVQVGDQVELMDELPPLPPPVEPAMNPPTITCSATPATIRVGESASVRCAAVSPDQRPVTVTYAADNGQIIGRGENVTFDARNARPGMATITATATDDRNISGTAVTRINVQSAAGPEAAPAGNFTFKNNSAYVDNQAKALLDDIALRLQQDPAATVLLVGYTVEPEAARLGPTRATNAKNYLVKDKGIDAARINTADGGRGNASVAVWWIPAGATMPTITPRTEQPQEQ